ncbi:homeobox-leucine zipper protein HOX11-like [Camellia sinensis]|uniref:homeobox-leucine zipper protein HOX11-like n=1 Tax=Camellia sinensis TaxID=4442 RepID=UPI0010366B92|nr:homeobox-leucine zipper protein HOX11-like [Camellia sinensis]
MELGLSLGDPSRPFGFLAKDREVKTTNTSRNGGVGFCMGLGINNSNGKQEQEEREKASGKGEEESEETLKRSRRNGDDHQRLSIDPPLQLDLLPRSPVPRNTTHQGVSWPSDNGSSEGGSSGQRGLTAAARGFDVNRMPPVTAEEEAEDGAAAESSPNSVAAPFQMDFCIYRGAGNGGGNKRASSRASDDDENGLARKKLRLSKEQSAYLEESFKEHNTLNPKQKLALAKQLNLRPRQVEVWFQNRRARTKLKQTEVDCEYLKRCCETLTEENRRLHKELQELRALKTSNPFYMQLPATTLTMCPSCERVATTTTTTTPSAAATTNSTDPSSKATTPFPISRPRFYPFSQPQPQSQPPHQSSAAS